MTVNVLTSLILGAAAVSFVGCTDATQPQPPATAVTSPAETAPPVHIALLGDQTRIELLSTIAAAYSVVPDTDANNIRAAATIDECRVTITTGPNDTVAALAPFCSVANLAVVAVDARNGPMPVHREHILFARQMHIPAILIAFTHSDAIDDPELLELEELEMRELLSAYDWNGDEAIVAFDSDRARVEHTAGALMGARALSQPFARASQRSETAPTVEAEGCTVEVYALAEQEAFPLKTTGISSGKSTVVIGECTPTAIIQSASSIEPGKLGSVTLTFNAPQSIYAGQRCAILSDNHVAAVGVITTTEP